MPRVLRSVALLLVGAGALAAQQTPAAKPTLASADYAKWESLGSGELSPDGKWVAYDFRRGNGERRASLSRGRRDERDDRAVGDDAAVHEQLAVARLHARAGHGGRSVAGAAAPRRTGWPRRHGCGRGAATPNRNKVVAVDLRSGRSSTFDDVQSYSLSSDGSHIALRRYGTPGRRGADIIVRDLDAGTELTFGNVSEFGWSDDRAPCSRW